MDAGEMDGFHCGSWGIVVPNGCGMWRGVEVVCVLAGSSSVAAASVLTEARSRTDSNTIHQYYL